MNEKPVLVTQSSMPPIEEYIEEIRGVFDSKWLTNNGEKHQLLESLLRDYLKVPELSLFANGHLALYIALEAFGFPEGGEVITTPYSFASTTHAIVQSGLKPVFCDIEMENYTIDASKIEELITDKTVAIVPVHVYGHICDVEEIEEVAKRHKLKVIYDAAHAFGVEYKGIGVGSFGDASMFSFHATKVYNTIEGGGLAYRDFALRKKVELLKNFGITSPENVESVGMNAKMNEFSAAMGICNLRHIDDEIAKRKLVYNRYMERLSGIEGIKISNLQENVKPNYAYFPIVFDKDTFGKNRDQVFDELERCGILARKYFYPLISEYECYIGQFDVSRTPNAKYVSDNVLTLPMYADLSLETVDGICNIIKTR
ncbi:DegT/DnrJ/EryC1/StrS family aminotransferase [Candidatus Saccharibacteria bacterium]|nr:DegT/DnrJ/EryC1/StrS family aminotransferase [Candidatus Saccharibacteria bacterium]